MFTSVVSLVFLLLFIGSTEGKTSPVLLWGTEIPLRPAMPTVKKQEIRSLIASLLPNYTVVAFLENNLTARDFRCTKETERKESCYAHLSNVSPTAYYAMVEEALDALRSIANVDHISNTVDAVGQLQFGISCQTPGLVNLIGFNVSSSDRKQELASHDAAIATISQQLTCPVLYLYMSSSSLSPLSPSLSLSSSLSPSLLSLSSTLSSTQLRSSATSTAGPLPSTTTDYNRFRRTPQDDSNGKLHSSERFVIYFTKLILKEGKSDTELKITGVDLVISSSAEMKVTLNTADHIDEVQFDVVLAKGYALIKTFHLEGLPFRAIDVETPLQFSYYCDQLFTKANGTNSFLIFSNVQFQVLTKDFHKDHFKFGQAWHCVGYFTPAILSGLFVLVLMLAITGCGVCWIMDIHANDRFEDPTAEPFQAGRVRDD